MTANYTYDGLERMAVRTTQNITPSGTTHYLYDRAGWLLAEASPSGVTQTEYVWLDDLPLAVFAGVDSGTPTLLYVHADHLNRPIKMTDENKNVAWDAIYWPYGAVLQITGSATNNMRFPGQYYLLESGLHYNWHRHYDPTLGRYLQPDPLGFVNGPSIYAYAKSSPTMLPDPDGRIVPIIIGIGAGILLDLAADYVERTYCSCGRSPVGNVAGAVAGGISGGILGDAADPIPYPRAGLGGPGASGVTSRLSQWLSQFGGEGGGSLWAPTPSRPFSTTANLGRFVARWALVGAAAYAAYDLYRIGSCLLR